MYPFKHNAHTMSCIVSRNLCPCLPFTDTVPTTKQISRIGFLSFQCHLMLLNSGSLCKTCGSIWRLCLLGVTSPKTCRRYSLLSIFSENYNVEVFLSKIQKYKVNFPQCRKRSVFRTLISPGLRSCSEPKKSPMWWSAVWVIQLWDNFYQIFRNSWNSVKSLLQGKALPTFF